MVYIGADPASRKQGFCVCIIQEQKAKFIIFKEMINFVLWILGTDSLDKAKVCVEDSSLQNATFITKGNKSVQARISRNAGSNQAISKLAVQLFVHKYRTENVKAISPKQKGEKIRDNKLIFHIAKSFGIEIEVKTLSQDKRDAFMLAMKIYEKNGTRHNS